MPSRELDVLLTRNAEASEANTKIFERELAKRYRQAYNEIEAKLAALYEKMGEPPTIAEARRYNRLDMLKKAIAVEYKKLTKYSIAKTLDNSAESFAQGAYGTQWAYDQAVGVELAWPVLPVDAIRASVWSGATGENFSARLRQWNVKELLTLQTKITTGLAQGYGFSKMARTIKAEVADDYSRIVRIVRTEATRNYTQGHLDVYDQTEKLGVKARKKWVATLDTRTRDAHGSLDGEFADDEGLFHSNGLTAEGPGLFGDPAEDINCRCRVVEEIEGFSPELRRIRGEGIVEYTTFKDWAGERGWSESKGWDLQAKAKIAEEQARKY
jgi:SPP1 gp7 family putative phage head morphogenesis protein